MKFIAEYWSQITVIIGSFGFILKTIFEYRLKTKELKFKYFYELKSQKIIELYSKIVEIQMIIDRRKKDDAPSFETNMFRKRIGLDKHYWESEFYFSENTKKIFRHFLSWLKMFESKEIMVESPEIESNFEKITKILINEFKKEIK
ncbi:hypothetical protein FO675_10945 [Riemerella anatipestifer]|nr:hypothetical protein [Riemerella anatipestifer]MBO4234795.1 hypothetical protein [Riemerella anatipestifer]